ncbi:spore coat protein CotH [Clostridiaceae bacterium]|nr:spore coat protein CotH [Clostridiaceae bacterium]
MKGKEKPIALILIVFLFAAGWIVSVFQVNAYQFPEVLQPVSEETTDLSEKRIPAGEDLVQAINGITGNTNYRKRELIVDENFTSNLPLIIIDTRGEEPKRGVVWNREKQYYVLTGEDPYAYGEIFVINNPDGQNRPSDNPKTESLCRVKLRGNSSGNYDKKQYLIKLTNKNGKPKNHDILGMGSDSDWILNVSFIDKSLLRNYLAYMTVGEIMPYTPDVQFCEVLWRAENGYRYEGVYMMMERVNVGKHRVDLPQYSENSPATPALLRRDRYNENGIMLDNYATQKGLTSGFLDIEYPEKEVITEKGIQNITEQVNRFERALYANEWEDFVEYRNYVDMQSFVDYFILNEYFLNYDAGWNSTYIYMNYSGKLTMGPVWDFDQAMDNNETVCANLETTAFHSTPWFDQMLKDPVFTAIMIERYAELRASILSDEAIASFVEKTIAYLGSAIDRDWARWGYYYTEGNYLKLVEPDGKDRNTNTHPEEVARILNVLSQHGAWMDDHLDSLYQFKMISLEDAQVRSAAKVKDYRQILAVVFVAMFFISVKLVLQYESEPR